MMRSGLEGGSGNLIGWCWADFAHGIQHRLSRWGEDLFRGGRKLVSHGWPQCAATMRLRKQCEPLDQSLDDLGST